MPDKSYLGRQALAEVSRQLDEARTWNYWLVPERSLATTLRPCGDALMAKVI
jgi:hypothetical protein